MGFQKIAEKPWAYTLYRLDDGSIVLSVLCGGAGMYELNIPLDHATASKVVVDEVFLGKCADEIRNNAERYASRNIRI
jgi:hypothetical protein